MNSYKQQLNSMAQTLEYTRQQNVGVPKRSREEDQETQEENLLKKRQPKTLFRPWSDEQTETPENKEVSITKPDIPRNLLPQQPKFPLPAAALSLLPTPYQLAVQQQQRQTAMALQQAMYQRQLIMTQVWAQQRMQQHQQMMFHQQQQMRQQLFVFGQQQGRK